MPLHDILPPIEMSDATFLYIFGLLFVVLLLLFRYLYKKRKKPLTPFQILELCNFNDAKKTAFQLSYYGEVLSKEEKLKSKFIALKEKLEPYKYTKDTMPLPQKLADEFNELLEHLRDTNV